MPTVIIVFSFFGVFSSSIPRQSYHCRPQGNCGKKTHAQIKKAEKLFYEARSLIFLKFGGVASMNFLVLDNFVYIFLCDLFDESTDK